MDPGIIQLIGSLKDPALLVLVLALLGLGWLHITTIRENREDRKALMDLLIKNTDAINGIKNILSAMNGRPV